jgi:hypothetical protein
LDARLPEGNFYSVRRSFEEDVEKNLRLKLSYGDAESCVAIYRRDLDTLLEKHNLYYYMQMKNQRRLTEIMVEQLEPPDSGYYQDVYEGT